MAADLIIRTVDRATAKLADIAERIKRLTEPLRRLRASFRALADAGGLNRLAKGFKGVGSGISNLANKGKEVFGRVGAAAGVATLALGGFVNAQLEAGDALANAAARAGLTADEYQDYAYAASKAGIEQEKFGAALDTFVKSVGEAKLDKGKLAAFFKDVSPGLLKQLNQSKSTAGALDVVFKKLGKIKDGSVAAAVATRAFGGAGAEMVQLVSGGFGALQETFRESRRLGGSAEAFVAAAGLLDGEMDQLGRTMAGVSQGVATELFPAFALLAKMFREFLVENKDQIKAWAKVFGERLLKFADELPQRLETLKAKFKELKAQLAPIAKLFGGFGNMIAVVAGLIVGGPLLAAIGSLIAAFVSLGIAMGATPFGLMLAGIAAIAAGAALIYKNWDGIAAFFKEMWRDVKDLFQGFSDFVSGVFTADIAKAVRGLEKIFGSTKDLAKSGLKTLAYSNPITAPFAIASSILSGPDEEEEAAIEDVRRRSQIARNFRRGRIGAEAARPQPLPRPPPNNFVERRETSAKVMIEVSAPRGTKVKLPASNTAEVALNVGYTPELAR